MVSLSISVGKATMSCARSTFSAKLLGGNPGVAWDEDARDSLSFFIHLQFVAIKFQHRMKTSLNCGTDCVYLTQCAPGKHIHTRKSILANMSDMYSN